MCWAFKMIGLFVGIFLDFMKRHNYLLMDKRFVISVKRKIDKM